MATAAQMNPMTRRAMAAVVVEAAALPWTCYSALLLGRLLVAGIAAAAAARIISERGEASFSFSRNTYAVKTHYLHTPKVRD